MWFYFLIFLLIALFSLHKTNKTKIILFIFSGVLLFFIAAFRGHIDRDYVGYVTLYNKVSSLTTFRIEPTFLIISKIVKQVFNNVLYLFIIYALLGVSLKLHQNALISAQLYEHRQPHFFLTIAEASLTF